MAEVRGTAVSNLDAADSDTIRLKIIEEGL